ncbi:hydroxymethylbilane synthase [Murimonas intestini]|uniref:hydroxymethylbilane synthase n=1 Tax=Murimonas intestini TaxID=1337051 RepID=UPI0011DD3896|nr:hydroxymethylbilane synthase [Murimonas intestini]
MKSEVIIGSRESRLAVIQSEMVKAYIEENNPGLTVSLLTMKTTGDIILDRTLDKVGGKGLFVKELDKALTDGRSDLSVHSLKDMPMEVPESLPVVAYSKREDPRDVLVLPEGAASLEESMAGGLPIGCSSLRRVIQLKEMYPGASFKPVRGNVLTRLAKLDGGEYSALVLAAAGLKRLGLEERISRFFEPEEIIPSAGQGILAVQGKKGTDYSFLKGFEDEEAACAAVCERAFVRELNGGCSSPVAAHARIIEGELVLLGLYYNEETDGWKKGRTSMAVTDKRRLLEQADELGSSFARELCLEYRKGVQK